MDETAVYLNYSLNRTIHMEGEKTVSIMVDRSSSTRFTIAITIAIDGSKLLLFVILKAHQLEKFKDRLIMRYRTVYLDAYSRNHGRITGRWLFDTTSLWSRTLLDTMIPLASYWMVLSVTTVKALFHCWKKTMSEIKRFRRTILHCYNRVMSALKITQGRIEEMCIELENRKISFTNTWFQASYTNSNWCT